MGPHGHVVLPASDPRPAAALRRRPWELAGRERCVVRGHAEALREHWEGDNGGPGARPGLLVVQTSRGRCGEKIETRGPYRLELCGGRLQEQRGTEEGEAFVCEGSVHGRFG